MSEELLHDEQLQAPESPTVDVDVAFQSIDLTARTSRSRPSSRQPGTTRPPSSSTTTTTARSTTDHQQQQPSLFAAWHAADSPSYKTGAFVLLLVAEFCRHYGLHTTLTTLYDELQVHGVAVDSPPLWCELQQQCKPLLSTAKHSHALAASGSTLERLVDFCVHPPAQKAAFARCVAAAHSPLHVAVASSPSKRAAAAASYSLMTAFTQLQSPILRPSQRPSTTATEPPPSTAMTQQQHHETDHQSKASVAKKRRKKKPHRSTTSVNSLQQHSVPAPGTFGEPALVQAHRVDLQRDLTASRLLEKELRNVRFEAITTTPSKLAVQKRLGFHTLTPQEALQQRQLHDAYASELVLEKYGFAKRQDCALCQFAFLPFNLPHKVSFRGVMDVYDAWGYVPPDRDSVAKYKPPLCYDAVLVCRMCAQIVSMHAKQPPLRKAASLATLPSTTTAAGGSINTADGGGCTDPYALPPLLGEDAADHRDYYAAVAHARRMNAGDGEHRPSVVDSPARAIYAQQMAAAQLLSAKEWDVIQPDKSSTRHSLETALQPPHR